MKDWKLLSEIVNFESKWVRLVGERWLCDKGEELEYWRVEKTDSVIILPIQAGKILCVKQTFRPGVRRHTLDFPGGRLPEDKQPLEMVPLILQRELGISSEVIQSITPLNSDKWLVNSSFSNQGLWAFFAHIDDEFSVPEDLIGLSAAISKKGFEDLTTKLECLQCRTVLLEWKRQFSLFDHDLT